MASVPMEKPRQSGEIQVKKERIPSPEAMDTNNNNNSNERSCELENAERPTAAQLQTAPGDMRNARQFHSSNKQNQVPGSATNSSTAARQSSTADYPTRRTSSDMLRSLISPEFPSQTGTPTSASQLMPNLSSAFSFEGEFPTPIGSGTFSPQTADRLNRKRALSISPNLSSSSLDFNSLIRTSPTSLVNYITNSRGSSAGSIGHLSPSLFSSTNMHRQPPYSRPLQVSLRSGNYPIPSASGNHYLFSNQQSELATDGEVVQVKKEMDTSPESLHCPTANLHNQNDNLEDYHFFGGCGANIKMEPHLHEDPLIPPPPLIPLGLETVQEEPGGFIGSEEEEIMHSDQTDYSVMMSNGNECEFETKLGIIDNSVSDQDKQKRVYYSYPSVEEPHNNLCRWSNCNKQCDDLDDLVRHVNNDHIYRDSRKEFVCHWTGCVRERKPFKAQYMLLVHMRRHTGEKPHKCTYEGCTKAYSRLENLKTHLRSHTGERPYVCKYEGCGKAFSNASDCAKHMNRTHSDEKPYACPNPGCMKRYTDPSSRRKHMKNCQVNKKARTEDQDPMSGADEESSAEIANLKSSGNSKKTNKPRKVEKKMKPNATPTSSSMRTGGFSVGGMMGEYDGSGGSQGYISGSSQGYVSSSQTGYNSSGYETEYSALQEDEISRILQEQRLSDPADIGGGVKSHMTTVSRDSRQRERIDTLVSQNAISNHSHLMPQQTSHHFQSPPFQSSPASQYSSLSPGSQHYIPLPHATNSSSRHLPGEIHTSNSARHHHSGDFMFGGTINRSKHNRTASSGYSSTRSFSPGPKAGKSPDDIDGASIISSSLRSSNMTNSYSTFSSNSSRMSSPCSNSDPLRLNPTSPAAGSILPNHILGPQGGMEGTSFPQKHSLRASNSFPHPRLDHQQQGSNVRRHSDDVSNSSRPWQYSSQSSQYSYSGSELSDDLLENLPSDLRRNSFSKTTPLPLPESMQHNFNGGMEMEYGNGEHSSMGFGPHVNGYMNPTIPLRHFEHSGESFSGPHEGMLSQEHLSGEGMDAYINMISHHMSPSNNMVVGDMETFVCTLSEETQYLDHLLQAQSQNQVK